MEELAHRLERLERLLGPLDNQQQQQQRAAFVLCSLQRIAGKAGSDTVLSELAQAERQLEAFAEAFSRLEHARAIDRGHLAACLAKFEALLASFNVLSRRTVVVLQRQLVLDHEEDLFLKKLAASAGT